MPTISIVRDDLGQLSFEPQCVEIAAGDFLIWANHDKDAPHQPAPQGEPANYWMNDALPPFVKGQPAATSPVIIVSVPPDITYVDGLNPTAATGTIKPTGGCA